MKMQGVRPADGVGGKLKNVTTKPVDMILLALILALLLLSTLPLVTNG